MVVWDPERGPGTGNSTQDNLCRPHHPPLYHPNPQPQRIGIANRLLLSALRFPLALLPARRVAAAIRGGPFFSSPRQMQPKTKYIDRETGFPAMRLRLPGEVLELH